MKGSTSPLSEFLDKGEFENANNPAHAEGWATYVELKLYEYAKQQSKDNKFKAIMDYLYANQLSGFLLETRIDKYLPS